MEQKICDLLQESGFSVEKNGNHWTVSNSTNNEYNIELTVMSRTEEYTTEPHYYEYPAPRFHYFVLYSAGMQKLWLLREDELQELRAVGLDDRDTSPYLVKRFDRLHKPHLKLAEFRKA